VTGAGRGIGASPASALALLGAQELAATLERGVVVQAPVTTQLLTDYDRYAKLARDHGRDPVDLERALTAIAGWRAEIAELDAVIDPLGAATG
jgi:hypothetical protein